MPFFEAPIGYLRKQREQREAVARAAAQPDAPVRAKRLKRLSVDYPWLSPGVAVELAKGGYEPAEAKEIALLDLRTQYEENPAKFGDIQVTNPKKRLKAWIKQIDGFIAAKERGPSASAAFDPGVAQRGMQFGGVTDSELRQMRDLAKAALDSGQGQVMRAALGLIGNRSSGKEDPYTVQTRSGLSPAAETFGQRIIDPAINQIVQPTVRTAGIAANSLYEGLVATWRTGSATQAPGITPGIPGVQGMEPRWTGGVATADTRVFRNIEAATERYGPAAPLAVIASQTQGGQALEALVSGEEVDVGSGFLPDPQSQTGQEAAAAARRYSPFTVGGHAWTPGRAFASSVFSPDSTAFTVLSGLVDASVAMKLDPSAVALTGLGGVARARGRFANVDDAAGRVAGIERALTGGPAVVPDDWIDAWRITRRDGSTFHADSEAAARMYGGIDGYKVEPTRVPPSHFDQVTGAEAKARREAGLSSNPVKGTRNVDTGERWLESSRDVPALGPDETTPEGWAVATVEDLEAHRATVLENAGATNGRRPHLRGRDPVNWLYSDGAPVVTKLTEEADPWTIWNATGRRFAPELTARIADSADEGLTRQILAGELGTTIERVPAYREGLGIKPRFLTDVPSGVLDLSDTEKAAHTIDDYLVLAKADEATRQRVFNQFVRSAGRGDDYAVVDGVFEAFRSSMIAAGANPEKATELTRFTRKMWDDAQQWGVDAVTGDNLPMSARITNPDGTEEVFELPFGPRWHNERFASTIDMPDPRAVKRLVASPEFNALVNSPGWAGAVGLTDAAYSAWKVLKLLRPAWTVKVVGDEQLRLMATGNISVLNHPLTAITIALGNPQEGRWFGKSWYERLEGFGKTVDPDEVRRLEDLRAARARELIDADPFISAADTRRILNEEFPIPRSWGQRASATLRRGKHRAAKARTDITFAPWDTRDAYGASQTNRFSDFTGRREIYLNHFDVVDRTSEHWARGLAEELGRVSNEPATRRALRLTPEEFKEELWSAPWGKKLREQMAAGRTGDDPWKRVLNERGASDAYGDMIFDQLKNLVGDDEELRVALVTGKLGDVPLTDDWGRASEEAVRKFQAYQAEGRGPNHIKVERTLTKAVNERERDMGKFRSAVNALFDGLMTRPSNYLSRHPAFVQSYWGEAPQLIPALSPEARAKLAAQLDEVNLPRQMEQRVRNALHNAKGTTGMGLDEADAILKKRALDFTRDTLYDLSKRSNMMDSLRFVFPFGEAFKEILTVWARLAVEYPQTARRAQQGVQAAREAQVNPITGLPTGDDDPMGAGFFRWDPQTQQEVMTIPLSGVLTKLAVGVPIPLKSPVQGLNMVGGLSPGLGFALSIPASAVVPNKPSWDKAREILFPFGAPDTSDPLGLVGAEFAPTWFKSLSMVMADPRSDRRFANVVADVMAVKASTGEYDIQGPESHDEINRLLQDATEAARWVYAIDALATATFPSSPGFDAYVKENPNGPDLILLQKVRDEYREMIDKHGFDEGVVKFVEKFGTDNLLATARKSQSNVAGLTTSKEQRAWARSHQDLVDAYPETWALLAPEGKGHSIEAYEAQLEAGERDPKFQSSRENAARQANAVLAEAVLKQFIEEELGGSADNAAERKALREVKAELAREYDGYEPELSPSRTAARIRELERAARDDRVKNTDIGRALLAYFDAREEANAEARERGWSEVGAMEAAKASPLREWLREYADDLIEAVPSFRRMWEQVLERELAD